MKPVSITNIEPDKSSTVSWLAKPRTAKLSSCPLCKNHGSKLKFISPDRLHGVPGEYSYRQCDSCNTVYQDPQVISEDLALCYPANYYTHHTLSNLGSDSRKPVLATIMDCSMDRKSVKEKMRISIISELREAPVPGIWRYIGRILAGSRIMRERAFFGLVADDYIPRGTQSNKALDIGCGGGRKLNEIKRLWDAEGVEWDAAAAKSARRNTGCEVFVGDFREIDLPTGQYGLVLLNHVIEHLDDPIASLHRIWELLAPGGRVILVYPNHKSLGAKIFKDRWFPWETPRHLVFPSVKMLIRLAEEIGFKLLKLRTSAYAASYFSSLSRSYKSGKAVDEFNPNINLIDRCFGLTEKAMLAFGAMIGEEVMVVLGKPNKA